MTFTPPADTSVIVQSRGSEPVPNWILAKLLHRRRSLLRRFINMSIIRRSGHGCCATPTGVQRNYWDLPSENSRNLSVLFEFFLPSCLDLPEIAVDGHKTLWKRPRRIRLLQLSRMQKWFLTSYFNAGLRPGFAFPCLARLLMGASIRSTRLLAQIPHCFGRICYRVKIPSRRPAYDISTRTP